MLVLATVVLGIVLLLGSGLAILHLRAEGPPRLCAWLGPVHGLIAIAGLLLLIVALPRTPNEARTGTASFGTIAATTLTLALLMGLAVLTAQLRKWRLRGTLIGMHGTVAVAGFVILLVYTLLA